MADESASDVAVAPGADAAGESSAASAGAPPKNVGVVFVHGQGTDKYPAGEFAKLLNGLVAGLTEAGRRFELEVDADRQADGVPAPAATLLVWQPDGSGPPHRFRMREAFWDDAFPPPKPDDVLRWVLYGFGEAMDGVFSGWWADPSASGRTAGKRWWDPRQWRITIGAVQRLLFRAELVLLTGVFTPLILLYDFVLRPVTWLLLWASRTPVLRTFGLLRGVASAIEGMSPFMSQTMGDTRRIVSDETWARNIRGRTEDRAIELLDEGVDELVIVAYSAGATIVYDALLEGRRLPGELASRPEAQLRMLTFGSSINHLWTFASNSSDGLHQRSEIAERRLDPAVLDRARAQATTDAPFWFDIYSRFDVVPGGPLREHIAARAGVARDGKELEYARIVNYDNWVDDHGGYFANVDQFVPRLLTTMFNSREWCELESERRQRPRPGFTALRPNRRARSVFSLNLMKLLPIIGLPLHLAMLALSDRWSDFSEWVGEWFVDRLEAPFAGAAAALGTTSELVAGTTVFALLLVVLARASYRWSLPYIDNGHVPRYGIAISVVVSAAALALAVGSAWAVLTEWWLAWRTAVGVVAVALILLGWMLAPRLWRWIRGAQPEEESPWWRVGVRALSTAGVLVGLVVVLAWFVVSGMIHRGALRVEAEKRPNVTIERVDGRDVLLSGSERRVGQPGTLGLAWDEGYVQVSEATMQGARARWLVGDTVLGTTPLRTGPARIDGFAFSGHPSVAYEGRGRLPVSIWEAAYPTIESSERAVDLRAWIVQPERATALAKTWVVVVHGKGGTRAEGYRILPTLTDLGYTAMLITYRDDRESAQASSGRFAYGATEWQDVVAALRFAVRDPEGSDALPHGADRVVLYGYSMGGAVVASTIANERLWPQALRGDGLAAVVLDSPMLDFADTVEYGLETLDPVEIPGPIAGVLRGVAGQRFGISWEELSYIDGLAADTRPLLLIHGTEDELVPIATSRALAAARSDAIYVEVPGARHTLAWNLDGEAYAGCVQGFLRGALGGQGQPPVDRTCEALREAGAARSD